MALPVEDVLALWREAERIRDDLPTAHPDRARLDRDIRELRGLYDMLTSRPARSPATRPTGRVETRTVRLDRIRRGLGLVDPTGATLGTAADES
jgi:hypothetical protein